ncbi:hypothetical protein YPC_1947 [Yersinia pestis biovar Medievalis str. Harbin 35]|nr:hypothetical protein YPC_1947 [Yersinia pestis biovar Medievalis str. Harbin 35]EEO76678.1 hypothetical protein YP516_1976 [Yersinia pestis Nepal516]EEO80759.1 hypothetical protein YPF_2832 [Yersinia pestis biovar Orientalis str. India 195]EEO84252.1 hypothetical protein YPH_0057 [Yersinia pestis biovar Orientalis str. PEXU2]EEO90113.1 hypothetical protein YPS_2779 [Yersinia pestis Pestoides A]
MSSFISKVQGVLMDDSLVSKKARLIIYAFIFIIT